MRLLQKSPSGEITLTRRFHDETAIPPYAILSHTWAADDQEVTLDDIIHGEGQHKTGWAKLEFCATLAARDGLEYFWVDSCCINKSIHAELQHSISSMFRWYQRSAKCYVYMSDVSYNKDTEGWQCAFRNSRWFTRGWTLQELLAPTSIQFFSSEAELLGDIDSLEPLIHEITGIPQTAFRGAPLSQFSVNERMSWIEIRRTKLEEDLAYSLLGIFGVNLPLRYGEGKTAAFGRLDREIEKRERCLQDLRLIDPTYHKEHIEHIRGGLIKPSYNWILEDQHFQAWHSNDSSRLLWIKGSPGMGKTMLLCGIINDMPQIVSKRFNLAYFFCEATDSRINNATAVMRGLIYKLVCQQPSLLSHVFKKYEHAGKALFEDSTAWFAMSNVLADIQSDHNLDDTFIVIDALDECAPSDLPKLSELIVRLSFISSRVKWLISSRDWPSVEEQLKKVRSRATLCLELNTTSISTAVSIYIEHKVQELALNRGYTSATTNALLNHLRLNADHTFLWVALVCESLRNTPQSLVRVRLKSFPQGLNLLYTRMLLQVCESVDSELCKRILALIATCHEPITMAELASFIEGFDDVPADLQSLLEIIGICGSFLVVRNSRIYFVHQSAKDFLLKEAHDQIFPAGVESIHYELCMRSLQVMSKKLKRNIYNLDSLDYHITLVRKPDPDPLAAVHYSCWYWLTHLHASGPYCHSGASAILCDQGPVHTFLKEKLLYWLEAVCLSGEVSYALAGIFLLAETIQLAGATALLDLVNDVYRFIRHHSYTIENLPLQIYESALLFSPHDSLIRYHFSKEEPNWINIQPIIRSKWSRCLCTLDDGLLTATSLTFLSDPTLLVSASHDNSIKIWDLASGSCVQRLEGHEDVINSVTHSHTSALLASASEDMTFRIWDTMSGTCVHMIQGHAEPIKSVAFSPDATWLATASDDKTIKIWVISEESCLRTLKGHSSTVTTVSFSPDSKYLASGSLDCSVKIWDARNGTCLHTLRDHTGHVNSVSFSHDSRWLASASGDGNVRIWNIDTGTCLRRLRGHKDLVTSVAFSHDSSRLVSGSRDCTVRIWDSCSDTCLQTYGGHTDSIASVAFTNDSNRVASSSRDGQIKIWELDNSTVWEPEDDDHCGTIIMMAFSPDSAWFATVSLDGIIRIWDGSSNTCIHTIITGCGDRINSINFTPDSAQVHVTAGFLDHDRFTIDIKNGYRRWLRHSHQIEDPASSRTTDHIPTTERQKHNGLGLSSNNQWITYDTKLLVWIPPEYRPSCFAKTDMKIALGVASGKVWSCSLKFTDTFHEALLRSRPEPTVELLKRRRKVIFADGDDFDSNEEASVRSMEI